MKSTDQAVLSDVANNREMAKQAVNVGPMHTHYDVTCLAPFGQTHDEDHHGAGHRCYRTRRPNDVTPLPHDGPHVCWCGEESGS
jgi:hypothetical protein